MNRRGFLFGLSAALAAPAIIRTPGLLMPVKPQLKLPEEYILTQGETVAYAASCANGYINLQMIIRESIRLWRNSNAFIRDIDAQYTDMFAQLNKAISHTYIIRNPDALD